MIVYRLSRSKYGNDLSGKGAELTGGRWNSKGTALLYTCQSRALCTTEIAVHTPLGIVPRDHMLISIIIPDGSIHELAPSKLPADWKSFPHAEATQKIGSAFVARAQYLTLKVPSAVVQGEFNFLINPVHKNFYKVSIEETIPFEFDERLFKK